MELVPVAFNQGSTLLVEVSILLGEGLLFRVGRVDPEESGLYPSQYKTFRFSSNFYRRFIQGFRWIAAPLTSMLKTTGSSDLALRELGTNEVVGGDARADETVVDLSKSKSWRIVKMSEKPQRPEKLQRSSVWRNVYRSTDLSLIWYKELLALLKPLRSGIISTKFSFLTDHTSGGPWIHKARALVRFAGPKSFLETTFESITNKRKRVELLMLYHVIP